MFNSYDDVTSSMDDNIMRSSNTTLNDWTDAKFFIAKCTQGSSLWSELDNFHSRWKDTRLNFTKCECDSVF